MIKGYVKEREKSDGMMLSRVTTGSEEEVKSRMIDFPLVARFPV